MRVRVRVRVRVGVSDEALVARLHGAQEARGLIVLGRDIGEI